MKKIAEFSDIKKIHVGDGLIIQREKSIDRLNDDLTKTIIFEGSVYNARVINNVLFFQLNDARNMNTIVDRKVN